MKENDNLSSPCSKAADIDLARADYRPIAVPLIALLFVSCVAVTLTVLRTEWSRNWRYMSLIWNLFLAWLPLVFALAVHRRHQRGERRGWQIYSLAALWLLFLPNAPYIFTDLIHLFDPFLPAFLAGSDSGAVDRLHRISAGISVALFDAIGGDRNLGRTIGWLFTIGSTGLCSCGIYLGRFRAGTVGTLSSILSGFRMISDAWRCIRWPIRTRWHFWVCSQLFCSLVI